MSRLLQVIIALVGLTVSGVLGYASWSNDQLQTRQGYLMLFSQSIAVARQTCDDTMLQVAQDAAQKLDEMSGGGNYQDHVAAISGSALNCSTTQTAAADTSAAADASPALSSSTRTAETPSTRGTVGREVSPQVLARAGIQVNAPMAENVAVRLASRTANLEFRREQNAANAPVTNQFYAVLGSYDVADPSTYNAELGVTARYAQLAHAIAGQGVTAEVWRTRNSNHFAIVLVPDGLSRDNARELVSRARSSGWSSDAFVQEKRNWTQCAHPDAIRAESDCPAAR